MKQLTIAVPTYQRTERAVSLIEDIRDHIAATNLIHLLVIDNASGEGSIDLLKSAAAGYSCISVRSNPENIGFAGNILELFKHASTKYIMLLSDEDDVVMDSILDLIRFLATSPSVFISPQFEKDHGGGAFVYRGKHRHGKIHLGDFHSSSFYISGLVFDREVALPILGRVYALKETELVAFIYPLVCLVAELMLENDCYWYPYTVTKQGARFPVGVKMPDSTPYNFVSSRIKQYISFIRYFSMLESDTRTAERARRISTLMRLHKEQYYEWVRWGIALETPELLSSFDRGRRVSLWNSASMFVRQLIMSVVMPERHKAESAASIATKATWRLTRKD